MPFVVKVDTDEGYAEVTLSGAVDVVLLMEASAQLHELCSRESLRRQVWDARRVSLMDVSMDDAALIEECAATMRELGYEVTGRRAVVAKDGYVADAASILVELLEPVGVEGRVFRDMDNAIAWVLAGIHD